MPEGIEYWRSSSGLWHAVDPYAHPDLKRLGFAGRARCGTRVALPAVPGRGKAKFGHQTIRDGLGPLPKQMCRRCKAIVFPRREFSVITRQPWRLLRDQ